MARGRGETGRRSGLKIRLPNGSAGSSPAVRTMAVVLCLALSSGCDRADKDGPIAISVIGGPLQLADPERSPLDAGASLMLHATAQGLVAFDAEGRIEPALAERWIMTDDGLSFIFRIRRTEWSNGRPVTSVEVANRLNRAMRTGGVNRLRGLFGGVERAIAMTGQVVEVRLRRPEPDILQLFAQPEMALFRVKPSQGAGPYRVHSRRDGVTRLRPKDDADEQAETEVSDRKDIRARGEGVAQAVARFSARNVALASGGSFADLPIARAARPSANQFRVDPAYGLFGLAVMADSKALADVRARRALAMAIDRPRLVRLFGVANWQPALSTLPLQLDSAAPPAALEWVQLDLAARRARAKSLIDALGAPVEVRVALPQGPGARLLFAGLAADWQRIGVTAQLVGPRDPADLRLIDEVAPQTAAYWYLSRISCARGLVCSDAGETALRAASASTDPNERASALAEADAAIASAQPFIPLALPLRWSLVASELTGWRPSAFATHPLRHLRER